MFTCFFLSSSLKAATFESHTIEKKLALYNRDEGGWLRGKNWVFKQNKLSFCLF